MAKAISQLDAATSMADADLVPGVQGGTTKKFTAAMVRIINFLAAGVQIGQRQGINFIAGSSTSISVVDDSGNSRVNVTIGSTATPNNDPATKVFKYRNFM